MGRGQANLVLSPNSQEFSSFFPEEENSTNSASSAKGLEEKKEARQEQSESRALDSSMRQSSSSKLPELCVFPFNREQQWEELEVILNGRTDHLELFHNLHASGLALTNILRSTAHLASRPSKRAESVYFEHISTVASYLSLGRAKRELKLALLKTLMSCLSPIEAKWQLQDTIIEGTLDFLTGGSNEWEFLEHTEMTLIWELRAMSLRKIEREQERLACVANTGDVAAIMICAGAKLVESGMTRNAEAISDHIQTAGKHMKRRIKPGDYPLMLDRDAIVALTFSDAAKRASESAREGTRRAVCGIRDASTRGVQMVASKFEDGKLAENVPPQSLEVIKAAGKVGIATLGAAAIIGEALIETSRTVAQNTAVVAADVIEHKYGTSAGKVVSDAGETAGNLLRTVGNVAMFEGTMVAKMAAKNHVNDEIAKGKHAMHLLEGRASNIFKNAIEFVNDDKSQKLIGSPRIEEEQSQPKKLLEVSSNASCSTTQTESSTCSDDRQRQIESISSGGSLSLESNSISSSGGRSSFDSSFSRQDSSPSLSSGRRTSRIGRRGVRSRRKRAPLRPDGFQVSEDASVHRPSDCKRQ